MTSIGKHVVLVSFVAMGLALGCRTPQIVTQLERENYALESKIWELVNLLEAKQAELDACRSELNQIKSRTGAAGKTGSLSPPRELYAPAWPGGEGKTIQPSPPVGSSSEPFPVPEINVTPPSAETSPERALPGATSESPSSPSDENGINLPLLLAPPNSDSQPTPDVLPEETTRRASPLDLAGPAHRQSAAPVSNRSNSAANETARSASAPTRVSMPQEFLSGRNYDGEPGDDGIAVLIQPRDAQGQIVLEPAAISVVVIDPAIRGPGARVARWDLQPEEVRSYVVQRNDLAGFLLELPWPNRAPDHEDLKVFVRYYTPNGDYLESQGDVRIALPRPAP